MKKATISILLMIGLLFHVFGDDDDIMPYEHSISSEDVDLLFKVMRQPKFPESLRSQGFSSGRVHLLLELHFDGELRDWIVTYASHRDFAKSIERVIEEWEFGPPKRKGKPVSLIVPVEVSFRASGDVVSFNATNGLNHMMSSQYGYSSFDTIKVADVDNLDKFPEPVYVVRPKVPNSLIRKSDGSYGVFRFFIDTEGRVRLPHVDHVRGGKVDVRLLEAAQDALEEWEFIPPTVRGKKVIVELKQPFLFQRNR